MYAMDTVETEITFWPEDLRKIAGLPKNAALSGDVNVQKNRDGEVYAIIIKFETCKDRQTRTLKGDRK